MTSKWTEKVLHCRRTLISALAIVACVVVAFRTGADTTAAIAAISASLAGANAAQAFSVRNNERTTDASSK